MLWQSKQSKALHRDIRVFLPRLWRYCLVLTGSYEYAADLSQSVCVRVLENSHIFNGNTPLDRWAFRVAKNTWYNELRSNKIRTGAGSFSVDEVELVDNAVDSERLLINQDIIQVVLALPEAQRLTVNLVYIEGYSYKEASEILDIPIGTIMSRLAAARNQLSTKLVAFKGQA